MARLANMLKRRIVNMSVLPGEKLDGTGRVCIHLFVKDDKGPIVEPCAVHPVFKDGEQVKQQVATGPARGRLACDPKRAVAPQARGGVTTVTPRSDDPRAVTCPKCVASKDYAELSAKLN